MQPVHYSKVMKLPSPMMSEGEGECGERGIITPYTGLVTCKECKEIIEQEKKEGKYE